jgi:hypothetical protein
VSGAMSSLQALEIGSSCCKHTLLASPSVVNGQGALPIELRTGGADVALVQRLLAAGSAQAVDTNRHPHGFDALSGHPYDW